MTPSRISAAAALALAAALTCSAPALAMTAPSPSASPSSAATHDATGESRLLVELTNELREDLGLKPLKHSVEMNDVAQEWAEKMASGEAEYGHNPNYALEVPGGWALVGENVAYRSDEDVEALQAQWVNSPGHYANLTRPFTHMGAAVAFSEDGRMYGVQVFGLYIFDDLEEVPPVPETPDPEPTPEPGETEPPTPDPEPSPEPTIPEPNEPTVPEPEPNEPTVPTPEPDEPEVPAVPEPEQPPYVGPVTPPTPAQPVRPSAQEPSTPVQQPAPPVVTPSSPAEPTEVQVPRARESLLDSEPETSAEAEPEKREDVAEASVIEAPKNDGPSGGEVALWVTGGVVGTGALGVGAAAAVNPSFRGRLVKLFGR